jgi:hypothetical protein
VPLASVDNSFYETLDVISPTLRTDTRTILDTAEQLVQEKNPGPEDEEGLSGHLMLSAADKSWNDLRLTKSTSWLGFGK